MKLYYSRSRRALSWGLPFRLLSTLLGAIAPWLIVYMTIAYARRMHSAGTRLLRFLPVILPALFLTLGLNVELGKYRVILALDPEGRMFLLPPKGCSLKKPEDIEEYAAVLNRGYSLPDSSLEIQHVLSMHHLGRYCVVRVIVRGKALPKTIVISSRFCAYEELLQELEKRM